jgi:transposase
MSKKTIKTYTPAFKAQVALAAMAADKTPNELAQFFGVPSHLIEEWKKQLNQRAEKVFSSSTIEINE